MGFGFGLGGSLVSVHRCSFCVSFSSFRRSWWLSPLDCIGIAWAGWLYHIWMKQGSSACITMGCRCFCFCFFIFLSFFLSFHFIFYFFLLLFFFSSLLLLVPSSPLCCLWIIGWPLPGRTILTFRFILFWHSMVCSVIIIHFSLSRTSLVHHCSDDYLFVLLFYTLFVSSLDCRADIENGDARKSDGLFTRYSCQSYSIDVFSNYIVKSRFLFTCIYFLLLKKYFDFVLI